VAKGFLTEEALKGLGDRVEIWGEVQYLDVRVGWKGG
jgi:hypothetical protein